MKLFSCSDNTGGIYTWLLAKISLCLTHFPLFKPSKWPHFIIIWKFSSQHFRNGSSQKKSPPLSHAGEKSVDWRHHAILVGSSRLPRQISRINTRRYFPFVSFHTNSYSTRVCRFCQPIWLHLRSNFCTVAILLFCLIQGILKHKGTAAERAGGSGTRRGNSWLFFDFGEVVLGATLQTVSVMSRFHNL